MAARRSSPRSPDRPDLAAVLTELSRGMVAAEKPVLERHDLTMWGYIVLSCLARGPAPTQLELARITRADKTRLIAYLDELEAQRLVERTPDPQDRRAHRVSLTAEGRRRLRAAAADIRALEDVLLGDLKPKERHALEATLQRLAGEPLARLLSRAAGRAPR